MAVMVGCGIRRVHLGDIPRPIDRVIDKVGHTLYDLGLAKGLSVALFGVHPPAEDVGCLDLLLDVVKLRSVPGYAVRFGEFAKVIEVYDRSSGSKVAEVDIESGYALLCGITVDELGYIFGRFLSGLATLLTFASSALSDKHVGILEKAANYVGTAPRAYIDWGLYSELERLYNATRPRRASLPKNVAEGIASELASLSKRCLNDVVCPKSLYISLGDVVAEVFLPDLLEFDEKGVRLREPIPQMVVFFATPGGGGLRQAPIAVRLVIDPVDDPHISMRPEYVWSYTLRYRPSTGMMEPVEPDLEAALRVAEKWRELVARALELCSERAEGSWGTTWRGICDLWLKALRGAGEV